MRPRYLLLVFLLFFNIIRVANAQDVDLSTFNVANNLNQNGNHAEAAKLYQELIADGFEDAEVFYNLGLAHHQLGEWGGAVLNYERTLDLIPRDADARHNLRTVLDEVDEIGGETPFLDGLANLKGRLRTSELAIFALILWFLWAIFLVAFWRGNPKRRPPFLIAIGLTTLLLLGILSIMGANRRLEMQAPQAVVSQAETAFLATPDRTASADLVLPAGQRVRVLSERGEWREVRLWESGVVGWVSADTITPLDVSNAAP